MSGSSGDAGWWLVVAVGSSCSAGMQHISKYPRLFLLQSMPLGYLIYLTLIPYQIRGKFDIVFPCRVTTSLEFMN